MLRRPQFASIVLAAVALATLAYDRTAAAAATIPLLLPADAAFSALGHSCGGIRQQAFATGFDAATGYPTGDVYLQTRCGGSGRGGGYHTTTYSAWIAVTWDYAGTAVSHNALASAPGGLDPAFSAVDSFGNEIDNQLSAVNVLPANCSVTNTTYCTYRAYLSVAAGFAPQPAVTGVSATFGPGAGGTTVAIDGSGFLGASAVTFGSTPAANFVVNGDSSITALSPAAGAGTVDVTVTTAGGSSPANPNDQFTFLGEPVVLGISPGSGSFNGGTSVTISGANLATAATVYFGENPAGFTVNDDSSITALSPAGDIGDTVDVTVATAGGTSVAGDAAQFTYTADTASCADATMCVDSDGVCKLCGGPVSVNSTTVADALFVLNAAIGSKSCALCVCDVDGNGIVAATDALRTLRFAIGQNVTLACPPAP